MTPTEFFSHRMKAEYRIGTLVRFDQAIYKIAAIHDFETATGVNTETGRSRALRLNGLEIIGEVAVPNQQSLDIESYSPEELQTAKKRYEAIEPFLGAAHIDGEQLEARCKEFDIDPTTLYRWVKKYRSTGVLESLIPQKRGWKQGRLRLDEFRSKIIEDVIREYYLTVQRPSVQKAILEVGRRCHERRVPPPSPSTIRTRIINIGEKDRLKGRGQRERARNKFSPAAGSFPNADFPLAVVQIDHTPVDLILVDDTYRRPIGRPWLTLAFDVHSRVVTGYYLSFDPPSETSVALCVSHSLLQKDDWLVLHGIEANWPVWGVPGVIHVDNGADFRSDNFQNSCLMYGINLQYRPVRTPRYGGHIERILGTLLQEIHSLPGTTFSSIKERDSYDSEKHASMTLSEFESWLVNLICNVYHKRIHSSIGLPPLKKWEIGIFGNAETPGIGLPPTLVDRMRVQLDFLPSYRRTVQTFGVTIENLTYYDESLRHWINAVDPDTRRKREFIFRRDPRDISVVWFFDPTLTQYFRIPLADQSIPAMSTWEFTKVRDSLRKEGAAAVDKVGILRTLNEMRALVEQSAEKTKKARRQAQRRKEHEKKISPAQPFKALPPPKQAALETLTDLIDGDVPGFGDIA